MNWCMFDLETLDTKPSATILSLGAVKFDPRHPVPADAPKLSLRFDLDDQALLNRSISDDTITWWGTQSAAAQEAAFSEEGRLKLNDALDQFHKFVWNSDFVWSQGSFDVNIMEDLLRAVKRPFPWQYWQVCDSRTILNFIDGKIDRTKHHDAVEDAIAQANAIHVALTKIRWNGEKL